MSEYRWMLKYRQDQARVPKGNPRGGQWTSSGRTLQNYLEQISSMYRQQSAEGLVLEHGRSYEPQELPKGVRRGRQKECFMNAYRLAERRPDLTYVEGFAMPDFIDLPMAHAWCVDAEGRVVDNTWPKPGRAYVGIPFDLEFVNKVLLQTETYGVLDMRSEAIRERFGLKYSPDQPRIPAGHPHGGRWTSRTEGFAGKPANPDGRDTLEQYRRADGTWTPEREALHQKIMAHFFEGKTPVDDPQSWVMGGGPAAGKSTLLREGEVVIPENTVLAAGDDIKKMLPEYAGWNSGFVHEESSYLSKKIAAMAAGGNYNVLMDGTGDSRIDKLARKVRSMSPNGQPVHGIYVTVDTDVAVARALARAEKTGRWMPESVVRACHAGVSAVFPIMEHRNLYATLRLYDTTGGSFELIAREEDGVLTVLNPTAYERFLEKAEDG